MLARVPLRARLTAAFVVVMALVLAGTGFFLYLRLGSALSSSVDTGLRSRAEDVATLVRETGSGLGSGASTGLLDRGESFAQVLSVHGRVIDSSPGLGAAVLLDPEQLRRVRAGPITVERGPVGAADDRSRILALPVDARGTRVIVAVGASLEPRDEALAGLRTQLLVGGPLALLLASAAGYALASLALRPVETMRLRAARIGGATGERLPLPPARDEIRRLGETLNEMLDRLEAISERERRFVADASHELRTPLALLRTELELASRRQRTREELSAALRSAGEETERLSRLADDLLVLARADEGALPLCLAEVEAGRLLESVAGRFRARAARLGRVIAIEPSSAVVRCDRERLEQALGNLVDNALRHGAGTVTLSAETSAAEIRLRVADEGPGFPDALLPSAFERFARGDEARARGGTGLGLSIVAAVAEAHGGSVSAANLEPGADVSLALPLPAD